MSNRTATITQVYLNNGTAPTSVSKTVNLVVVDNKLVPDFRDLNPGVIDSKHTEAPKNLQSK